jgi:hypothetical protein
MRRNHKCLKKRRSDARAEISGRGKPPRRRLASSSAKKWSTSAAGSTARAPQSRRLPSVFRRRAARASSFDRRGRARPARRRASRPRALTEPDRRDGHRSRRRGARVPCCVRCGASGTPRHLARRWLGRPGKPHANGRLAHDQMPPSAQPVRGDQSEHGNGSQDFTPWSRLQPRRAPRRAAAALEGTRKGSRCAGSCRGAPEPSRFAATRGRSPAPDLR